MTLHSYVESHIGQRKVNEDSCCIDKDFGLYIVADGVGGLNKGELASSIACDVIQDCIKAGQTLSESVYVAHRTIISEIKLNLNKKGMATTVVAILFTGNEYEIAWVGDSRVYLWDGHLKLLTKDDSYVQLLFESGHIGLADLETHPDRNIISQALGIERKEIIINSNYGTLEKDQILLLCSDGLYNVSSEEIIINHINKTTDVTILTKDLVDMAVDKDGKDNISLICIKSDTNTPGTKKVILATIFREFDDTTGQIIVTDKSKTKQDQEGQDKTKPKKSSDQFNHTSDPELIDQTTFSDLSVDDRNLLNVASVKSPQQNKSKKHIVPMILFLIIIIVSVLVFGNFL